MQHCSIVIGSLWGDEGKGHMTDILCSQHENTLNVRFNGGAQASHTVVTPDGKRHAFRHFGAGTFAGAKTYLVEEFIVNPVAFAFERKELAEQFGIRPVVFVHPNCIVTTVWDVFINQALEVMRDKDRHGSCGYGINETVERSKNLRYRLTVKDLVNEQLLRKKLIDIQNEYVPQRLKDEYGLTIQELPKEYQELINYPENIDMCMFYACEFLENVLIRRNSVITRFDNVVFEGAQGLLLDQNNVEYYPHVTSSNTGIKNVMTIFKDIKYAGQVDIYYMSRCYLTRHGAGPFKNELGKMPYKNISDPTNIPNEFQGALRFGYLNFDLLISEILKDLSNLTVSANVHVTFTCLDQVDSEVKYIENGKVKSTVDSEFLNVAWDILKSKLNCLHGLHATNGLTRNFLISHKNEEPWLMGA